MRGGGERMREKTLQTDDGQRMERELQTDGFELEQGKGEGAGLSGKMEL